MAEWLHATVAAARDTVERLFADAIVLADEQSSSGWTVTRDAARIRLNVGRLATLAVDRQNLEFGVPKAHLDALIRQLPENSAEIWPSFRSEPNAALCSVSHEIVVTYEAAIREALGNYIPIAAATAARSPFGRSHSHEVVVYLSERMGRDLPEPDFTVRSRRPPPEPPAPAVCHPR